MLFKILTLELLIRMVLSILKRLVGILTIKKKSSRNLDSKRHKVESHLSRFSLKLESLRLKNISIRQGSIIAYIGIYSDRVIMLLERRNGDVMDEPVIRLDTANRLTPANAIQLACNVIGQVRLSMVEDVKRVISLRRSDRNRYYPKFSEN